MQPCTLTFPAAPSSTHGSAHSSAPVPAARRDRAAPQPACKQGGGDSTSSPRHPRARAADRRCSREAHPPVCRHRWAQWAPAASPGRARAPMRAARLARSCRRPRRLCREEAGSSAAPCAGRRCRLNRVAERHPRIWFNQFVPLPKPSRHADDGTAHTSVCIPSAAGPGLGARWAPQTAR